MSRNHWRGFISLEDKDGLALGVGLNEFLEIPAISQINAHADKLAQPVFQTDQFKQRKAARFVKFGHQIDIRRWPRIAARNGAEDS